jgi:hypothetical protein
VGPVAAGGTFPDGGESPTADAGAAGVSESTGGGEPTAGGAGGDAAAGGFATTGGVAAGGAPAGGTAGAAAGGTIGGAAAGGTTGGSGSPTGGRPGTPNGCGELLLDGAFAAASDAWTADSTYPNLALNVHSIVASRGEPALVAEGVEPYSDEHLAWLGGVPASNRNHVVSVSQTLTLPENLEELSFAGAVRIATYEVDNSESYDQVYVELRTLDDELGWQFASFDNRHAGGGWFEIDSIDPHPDDLDALSGRTLVFTAYSRTDLDGITHFWFDSLSLFALCGD